MAAALQAASAASLSLSLAQNENKLRTKLTSSFTGRLRLGSQDSAWSEAALGNCRNGDMVLQKSVKGVRAMAPPKAGGKAKKVVGLVKLALEAGKATPAPPVGPALGAKGVNIMMFCKEYNAKTADKPGFIIPVEITVYDDKSFTFILKTPPASILLLKACGAERGSSNPKKEKVGKVTQDQVRAIAQEKLPDLNCTSIESAMRIIAGTAANMGIDVVPPILEPKVKVLP